MNILVVEKFYYPYSGPQDFCIDMVKILRRYNHTVSVFDGHRITTIDRRDASRLRNYHTPVTMQSVAYALYSQKAAHTFARVLDRIQPDIVHINNMHHSISPLILIEAHKRHIPVVYHLHDYKLVCPAHTLLYKKSLCQACKQKHFFSVLTHRCGLHDPYRFYETIYLFGESVLYHAVLNIYRYVDVFIAPSTYVADIHRQMGFSGNIVHIPHFVFPQRFFKSTRPKKQKTFLYIGRIAKEKGIQEFLCATEGLPICVRIAGVGKELSALQKYVKEKQWTHVVFLGFLKAESLRQEILEADACLLPSFVPEAFGKTIIEAFSLHKPVIASQVGAIPEIITNKKEGILFDPRNPQSMRDAVLYFLSLSSDAQQKMGAYAYGRWKSQYAPKTFYHALIRVYTDLLLKKSKKRSH